MPLYFAGPRGTIGCLDAGGGRLLWRVYVIERFGSLGTEFGYSCSPTVVDGKVILPVGGRGASMVALDAGDGSIVWQAGDDAASYTPGYPITFQNRRLVLGYLQYAMVCHDLRSGKLVWRYELSSGYAEHSAWPIYFEPHFLLCRRLSLVFEWVFLCGFAAALPFALAGTHCFHQRRWRFAWICLMTVAAFASFYWSAAAVLWLKR